MRGGLLRRHLGRLRGLACEGCGTDCGACGAGGACDPPTGACAEWCRVVPTDEPLRLGHRPVTVFGQVQARGEAVPDGCNLEFRLADGPGDPVVVAVTGGRFEASLRTGVWEATVRRDDETWAAPVRVAPGTRPSPSTSRGASPCE